MIHAVQAKTTGSSKKLAQPSVEDKGPEYANLEVSGLPMSKMFKEAVRIAFAVRPPHLHRKTNKNRRDKCVLLGLATYLLWKKDAMEQVVRSNVPDTFPFKDEIERKEEIVDIDEIDCNNDDFKEKAAEDFSAQTAHAVLKRAAAAITAEERVDSNFDYVQEFESESSPYAECSSLNEESEEEKSKTDEDEVLDEAADEFPTLCFMTEMKLTMANILQAALSTSEAKLEWKKSIHDEAKFHINSNKNFFCCEADINLFCDNQDVVIISTKNSVSERTKHIAFEQLDVETEKMPADIDILTKTMFDEAHDEAAFQCSV